MEGLSFLAMLREIKNILIVFVIVISTVTVEYCFSCHLGWPQIFGASDAASLGSSGLYSGYSALECLLILSMPMQLSAIPG